MKPEGRLFHAGISFLCAPVTPVTPQKALQFQQEIISRGLEFSRTVNPPNGVTLFRDNPSPLQIQVNAEEQQPVGQLLIIAAKPNSTLEMFTTEAETAVDAFEANWPSEQRIILHADATIRHLYEATSKHAFQELWEVVLGRKPQRLGALGRPLRGGGLRFVMDPVPNEPYQIEVKIESYLQDTSKMFLETQFTWQKQNSDPHPFQVANRIQQMSAYIQDHVIPFVIGGNNDSK